MNYDLEERTSKFSEDLIELCKKVPKNTVTIPVLDQLMRCGTSIGANYVEASGASSKKDFKNKIFICLKEAKETKYWLRLVLKADPNFKEECQKLWQEVHELTLIFSKITRTTKIENL